jgi:hypothetical protein
LPVKMFSICTPRFWKRFPTRWKNSRTLRNGSPRVPLPSASANTAPTRAVPEHGDGAELEGEPGNGDGVSTKSTKRHGRNALRNFSTHLSAATSATIWPFVLFASSVDLNSAFCLETAMG